MVTFPSPSTFTPGPSALPVFAMRTGQLNCPVRGKVPALPAALRSCSLGVSAVQSPVLHSVSLYGVRGSSVGRVLALCTPKPWV